MGASGRPMNPCHGCNCRSGCWWTVSRLRFRTPVRRPGWSAAPTSGTSCPPTTQQAWCRSKSARGTRAVTSSPPRSSDRFYSRTAAAGRHRVVICFRSWRTNETTVRAWIGSGTGDCAPAPSHTTGRTVFRIRRLDPAAYSCRKARQTAEIDGLPFLVHRFLSGWTRPSPWLPPTSARHGSTASTSACSPFRSPTGEGPCGPGLRETGWALVSVAPLALLLGPSALRSSGVTRLPRYYGLC